MRNVIAALVVAGATAGLPAVAYAQSVIVTEPSEREVIVREPAERVIVREPEERRVIVREPSERVVIAPQVRSYVVQESRPSIRYERKVVVGDTLPDTVDSYSVPDSDYRYTVVNDRRYLLDSDRRVIEVVD